MGSVAIQEGESLNNCFGFEQGLWWPQSSWLAADCLGLLGHMNTYRLVKCPSTPPKKITSGIRL